MYMTKYIVILYKSCQKQLAIDACSMDDKISEQRLEVLKKYEFNDQSCTQPKDFFHYGSMVSDSRIIIQ